MLDGCLIPDKDIRQRCREEVNYDAKDPMIEIDVREDGPMVLATRMQRTKQSGKS